MNGSYLQVIDDCEIELNHIQQWISNHLLDSNVKYLTSYAVVKACGTIENVLKQMIFDCLADGAKEEVQNYLTKNIIDASFNPSPGQVYRILETMNSEWRKEFENVIKGTNEKGCLTSLVELRNSFAHGTSITASINDVKNYFHAGIWILEQLNDVIQQTGEDHLCQINRSKNSRWSS